MTTKYALSWNHFMHKMQENDDLRAVEEALSRQIK
jgi:hypothetical protein